MDNRWTHISTHISKTPLPDTIEASNKMLSTIIINLTLISPKYL